MSVALEQDVNRLDDVVPSMKRQFSSGSENGGDRAEKLNIPGVPAPPDSPAPQLARCDSGKEGEIKILLQSLEHKLDKLTSKLDKGMQSLLSVSTHTSPKGPPLDKSSATNGSNRNSNSNDEGPQADQKYPSMIAEAAEDEDAVQGGFHQDTRKGLPTKLTLHRFETVWDIVEHPDTSRCAFFFDVGSKVCIMLSVAVSLLQHVWESYSKGVAALVVELAFDLIFAGEMAVRMLACPNLLSLFKRFSTYVDLVSAAGFVVRLIFVSRGAAQLDSPGWMILVCVIPVVRLAKLTRHFETLCLLTDAFESILTVLPVLFYLLAMITLIFSAFLYVVEPRENLESLSGAMWMTIVTVSTVGYGDKTPTTSAGYVAIAVLVCISCLFVAMPVGIVGNSFWLSWQRRDRVVLIARTRAALKKWGYSAEDIKMLFNEVDENGSGTLDVTEFMALVHAMRIGLSPERAIELFELFDYDRSGTIDHTEFIREIFPGVYLDMCRNQNQQARGEALKRAESVLSVLPSQSLRMSVR